MTAPVQTPTAQVVGHHSFVVKEAVASVEHLQTDLAERGGTSVAKVVDHDQAEPGQPPRPMEVQSRD